MVPFITTLQDGNLVFETQEDPGHDEEQPSGSFDYITVLERVPDASPSGYNFVLASRPKINSMPSYKLTNVKRTQLLDQFSLGANHQYLFSRYHLKVTEFSRLPALGQCCPRETTCCNR